MLRKPHQVPCRITRARQSQYLTLRAIEVERESGDSGGFHYYISDESLIEPFEISEGVIIPVGEYSFDTLCGGRTSTSSSRRYSMSMIPSFPTAPLPQDFFRCAPTLLLQTPCIGKISYSTTMNRTAWASTVFSVTNPQLVERLFSLSIKSTSIFHETAHSPR